MPRQNPNPAKSPTPARERPATDTRVQTTRKSTASSRGPVESATENPPVEYDPKQLETRVRYNIGFLKAFKRVSDATIAEHGGFTNRQVVNNRINGGTNLTMEDLARIASALTVEPHVLFMPLDEMSRWLKENPTYEAPRYTKQPAGRQGGK